MNDEEDPIELIAQARRVAVKTLVEILQYQYGTGFPSFAERIEAARILLSFGQGPQGSGLGSCLCLLAPPN
jgi:hypothetical protein